MDMECPSYMGCIRNKATHLIASCDNNITIGKAIFHIITIPHHNNAELMSLVKMVLNLQ